MFPIANSRIAGNVIYEWSLALFRWAFPHGSAAAFGTLYIIIRKSFHFFEYAVLSYLIWRAFMGMSRDPWTFRWIFYAGAISLAYGITDELLQLMVPNRRGSVVDVLYDTAGILFILWIISLRRKRILCKSL